MAEFDPDAFLAGQETKVEKTKTTEDKQPEVATQQAAASDTSGFDPDAFLSGQTEQAQQAQATTTPQPEGPVAPQFMMSGPTGFNGQAVADTAGALAKGAGAATMNYVKNPLNVVADVALAHMGVPPVAAAKSAYDTYQTAKDAAAIAAKNTSKFDQAKSLNTLYDPLKRAVVAEHPEMLQPIQEAFAKSGPQGVKNVLTSAQGQKILNNPATRDAAQAFISGVPGVGTQIGRAVMPVARMAGKVLGPAGLALNAYDAAQYAQAAELGKRLAQGQGQQAQHAYHNMNVPYGPTFNQNIPPDQAQNILASGNERDIAAFGGRAALNNIAKAPVRQAAAQPPTPQNFIQRMAALSTLYAPARQGK